MTAPATIFGVGLDIGVPLFFLLGLAVAGVLMFACRPAERVRRRRQRGDKRQKTKRTATRIAGASSRGKHHEYATVSVDLEEGDDVEDVDGWAQRA